MIASRNFSLPIKDCPQIQMKSQRIQVDAERFTTVSDGSSNSPCLAKARPRIAVHDTDIRLDGEGCRYLGYGFLPLLLICQLIA